MNIIKPIEPIYPLFFNIKLEKKVDEQKKKKVVTEPKKSFAEYLEEAIKNK
jgi:hypothetical protein